MADVRTFLFAYDIGNSKRRLRVARLLERVGERQQYSVFVLHVSARRAASLERRLRGILKDTEDKLLVADLGPTVTAQSRLKGEISTPYGDSII
jgi:CRISPR-associated protein Cas2